MLRPYYVDVSCCENFIYAGISGLIVICQPAYMLTDSCAVIECRFVRRLPIISDSSLPCRKDYWGVAQVTS